MSALRCTQCGAVDASGRHGWLCRTCGAMLPSDRPDAKATAIAERVARELGCSDVDDVLDALKRVLSDNADAEIHRRVLGQQRDAHRTRADAAEAECARLRCAVGSLADACGEADAEADALRAMLAAATPGPIDVHRCDDDGGAVDYQLQRGPGTGGAVLGYATDHDGSPRAKADAALWPHASDLAADLLDAHAALATERERAEAAEAAARGTLATPTLAVMRALHNLGGCWLVSYDDDATGDPVVTIEYFDGARALAEKEGDNPVRWVAIDRCGRACAQPVAALAGCP